MSDDPFRCHCCGQPLPQQARSLHLLEGFSPMERIILEALGRHMLSFEALATLLWGDGGPEDERANTNQKIFHLRQKLKKRALGYAIENVRGLGFKLVKQEG
jgi:DNA-binding response OmpR family regulator